MYSTLKDIQRQIECADVSQSHILFVQSLLLPSSVPGNKKIETRATGCASLLVLTDENRFYITLDVHNLKNITMAHLHFYNTTQPTTNGPILLWLVKKPPHHSRQRLVSQFFSTKDFSAPYTHMSMNEFIHHIQHGQLYFNVHTVQYPEGELAGSVEMTHIF